MKATMIIRSLVALAVVATLGFAGCSSDEESSATVTPVQQMVEAVAESVASNLEEARLVSAEAVENTAEEKSVFDAVGEEPTVAMATGDFAPVEDMTIVGTTLYALTGDGVDEDTIMMTALEAGADDVVAEAGGAFRVMTEPSVVYDVKAALDEAGIEVISADSPMVAENLVPVTDGGDAKAILRILEALEDNDDVQDVFSTFDMSDELMERSASRAWASATPHLTSRCRVPATVRTRCRNSVGSRSCSCSIRATTPRCAPSSSTPTTTISSSSAT